MIFGSRAVRVDEKSRLHSLTRSDRFSKTVMVVDQPINPPGFRRGLRSICVQYFQGREGRRLSRRFAAKRRRTTRFDVLNQWLARPKFFGISGPFCSLAGSSPVVPAIHSKAVMNGASTQTYLQFHPHRHWTVSLSNPTASMTATDRQDDLST